MILCPLSKVTTSATQFGAHEWLMYLQAPVRARSAYDNARSAERAFSTFGLRGNVSLRLSVPLSRPHDLAGDSSETSLGTGMPQ